MILTPHPAVVRINQNITLRCEADALPKPRYLWKFDGTIIDKEVQNTLSITNAQVKDAGGYTCKVQNFYGSKETTRMVNVECECIKWSFCAHKLRYISLYWITSTQIDFPPSIRIQWSLEYTTSGFRKIRVTRSNQINGKRYWVKFWKF